jgi:hypothetical protein
LNTLAKVLLVVGGLAVVGAWWTFYGVNQYGDYTGPDTSNSPDLYPLTAPRYDPSKFNHTNTTQPVQTYNLPKINSTSRFNSIVPTIGEVLRRSNSGFLYHSLAAEEETPKPWALLAR